MKKLFATISVIVMLLVVFSLPVMAQTNWSGPYIGLNTGYGKGKVENTSSGETTVRMKMSGLFFGVQLGYNHEFESRFVLGVEADFHYGR